MDISENILNMDLNERYRREIFGLGEVYEIMSVEIIRRKLLKKFGAGRLYLASNAEHGGRGKNIEGLKNIVKEKDLEVAACGFCDSPPWRSAPAQDGRKKQYPRAVAALAKTVFFILIRLERLWEGRKNSHMIYCLAKK